MWAYLGFFLPRKVKNSSKWVKTARDFPWKTKVSTRKLENDMLRQCFKRFFQIALA